MFTGRAKAGRGAQGTSGSTKRPSLSSTQSPVTSSSAGGMGGLREEASDDGGISTLPHHVMQTMSHLDDYWDTFTLDQVRAVWLFGGGACYPLTRVPVWEGGYGSRTGMP